MKLCDFDYYLPKDLVAQSPIEPRDASRLMVLRQDIEHKHFADIIDYFGKGDTLVLNDSRVIHAKLSGRKSTGGHVEALVVSKTSVGYECLVQGKNIREGTKLHFGELEATILDIKRDDNNARYLVDFNCNGNLNEILDMIGDAPLPPYIKKKLEDKNRYQTVYSREKGSIAAPTAGLHFTKELLKVIMENGVDIAYITLHVSLGTFTPVKVEEIENHIMEPEYVSVSAENAQLINENRGKLIAVGTTTVKALESMCMKGKIIPNDGFSQLFIYPTYKFKSPVDAIVTNFHLPRSTLLMLVSAFAGRERLLSAYNNAILNSYRFYSFGDAMLIFK